MNELLRELERRIETACKAEHLIGAKRTQDRIAALQEALNLAREAKRRMADREPAWDVQ